MDNIGVDDLSARRGSVEQLEESGFGDRNAASEADHGQLPTGDELIGEGSREPEKRTGFGHTEY
jgi:hypothetical protein